MVPAKRPPRKPSHKRLFYVFTYFDEDGAIKELKVESGTFSYYEEKLIGYSCTGTVTCKKTIVRVDGKCYSVRENIEQIEEMIKEGLKQ